MLGSMKHRKRCGLQYKPKSEGNKLKGNFVTSKGKSAPPTKTKKEDDDNKNKGTQVIKQKQ